MSSTAERARAFVNLHIPGQPVVLYNAWDAGSAQAVDRQLRIEIRECVHLGICNDLS